MLTFEIKFEFKIQFAGDARTEEASWAAQAGVGGAAPGTLFIDDSVIAKVLWFVNS